MAQIDEYALTATSLVFPLQNFMIAGAAIAAIAIMIAGLLTIELISDKLLLFFNASDEMLRIGIPALRILSLCYVFAGVSVVASGVFQGLGKGVYSLVLSVIRQLVILIPVAYLLSLTGNVTAVWFSFPIAEFARLSLRSSI